MWVKGLAHRGQYGDGRLTASPDFIRTADDAVAVKAHTGHAIYLRRDGMVLGTGGNRFGPLSSHGLGDKADRWGPIFDGARAIATGSRHSLAIRQDGSLWAWGEGFGIEPRKLHRRRARRRRRRHGDAGADGRRRAVAVGRRRCAAPAAAALTPAGAGAAALLRRELAARPTTPSSVGRAPVRRLRCTGRRRHFDPVVTPPSSVLKPVRDPARAR